MGSETSKLEAPEEFGQSGNQFQIVSPKSDLSCPSDIHRINRLRSLQNQHPKSVPVVADPNRRMSRTITKTLSQHQVKSTDVPPPPSHFYFPTKESERAIERKENLARPSEKENERPKLMFEKTKKMLKKTQAAMAGCFAEDQVVDLEAQNRLEETKHYPVLGIARKVLPSRSNHVSDHDVKLSSTAPKDSNALLKGTKDYPEYVKSPSAALHQADDYFTRLSGGGKDESPYVENKGFHANTISLAMEEPDTPVSNLFANKREDRSASTRTEDSIIGSSLAESDVQRKHHSPSPGKAEKQVGFMSPSNSAFEYQKAIGTVAETPGYYPDDDDEDTYPIFSDEAGASEPVTALATIAEKADDESSSTSDLRRQKTNAVSAFRPRQQVAYPLTDDELIDRKVSKLESLFRPVLPSLSADDAQTSGYDPWEIKVTESAPTVMTEGDYGVVSKTRRSGSSDFRRISKVNSHSPSMLSIDSQLDASPAMSRGTVSKQAQHNSEFLFAVDGKKMITHGRKDRESDMFSISTISARSRLPDHMGTKAVHIPHKKNIVSHDDESLYSKGSNQRVRFSLLDAVSVSVGLAPKESIDVPTIESTMSDLSASQGRRSSISDTRSATSINKRSANKDTSSLETVPLTGPKDSKKSHSSHLRFQSAKNKFQAQTVDVPQIPNKISDLSDDTEDAKGRTSAGSFKSLPEPIPEETEIEMPESVSGKSHTTQIHWSYSIKDGEISAATPYFGKDAKHATKSPYVRFENAKNKFNGKDSTVPVKKETAMVKKETAVVKKKSPYKSPRSLRAKQGFAIPRELKPGGSVASKVLELNQRVVEAKLDRKKHRWTKSNPRKYGVIESNAVRTRAIVQYKTDVVGLDKINYMSAAKFNQIPIDDDDSTIGSHADSHSKKSVKFLEPAPLLKLTSGKHTLDPEYDDEEASKFSPGDLSKLTADTASLATARQIRSYIPNNYSAAPTSRVSGETTSTTSSGFTNVKKQVFRGSVSSSSVSMPSVASHGESTTMSSILDKENSNYMSFRASAKTVKPSEQAIVSKADLYLSPTQRTPMQAQKWRNLAAAAHQRDSQKKQINGKARKGLSVKNGNTLPLAAYGQ